MDIERFKNLLERYGRGEANETERALVEAWYKSYDANESQETQFTYDKERIRASLQEKLHAAGGAPSQPKVRRLVWYRVAASLLAIALAGISYYSWKQVTAPRYYTVSTATGKTQRVLLPDSSVVWINAASLLRIPETFSNPREVFLEEGEAYFDVKRNPDQPFIVRGKQLDVRVLGTSFNVQSYAAAKSVKVSVASGKVAVTRGDVQLATLLPDQQLLFDKRTHLATTQTVNSGATLAWKDGDIFMRQVSFDELALVLRNTYGVRLTTRDTNIESYQFTLRLRATTPVDEVLTLVDAIHNTQHRKEGDDIVLY